MVDDLRAEGLHSFAGIQHIITFEQPLDACLPKAQRTQDQRPM